MEVLSDGAMPIMGEERFYHHCDVISFEILISRIISVFFAGSVATLGGRLELQNQLFSYTRVKDLDLIININH